MVECYSCGGEASPKSPRNFCKDCDSHFEAGLTRQQEVVARAERLEQAKAEGDSATVGKIMTELFQEGAVVPEIQPAAFSTATVKKVSE